jgi:hypothetical protein
MFPSEPGGLMFPMFAGNCPGLGPPRPPLKRLATLRLVGHGTAVPRIVIPPDAAVPGPDVVIAHLPRFTKVLPLWLKKLLFTYSEGWAPS